MSKISIICFLCILLIISTSADHLPNQTPENQVFQIDTVLDAIGQVDEATSMKWVIASPGSIPSGILGPSQSIADFTYKDAILTNGGKLSENKNFDFDSKDKVVGLDNLVTEKLMTYASTNGAHLVGEEEYVLDIAGNWADVGGEIRCVFASSGITVPAFCNIIKTRSELVNLNSGQISTKGRMLMVTDSIENPTELIYSIAVSPDKNSGSEFAEGTVRTNFAGSAMESRDWGTDPDWNKTAAERTWKDSTTVTGGIKYLNKVYTDPSAVGGLLSDTVVQRMTPIPTLTPTPGYGTITVSSGEDTGVPFTLSGPTSGSGSTPQTFNNCIAGDYTATGGSGWSSASGTLSAGGTLSLVISRQY